MNLEENSIKDPIDFAANLTLVSTSNAIQAFRDAKDRKEAIYKNRLAEDEDFDPHHCEECGADLPELRKEMFEVLCTGCKAAQEKRQLQSRRY